MESVNYPFYVKIEVLRTGRIRVTYWYMTDCKDITDTEDIPIKRIINWLGNHDE